MKKIFINGRFLSQRTTGVQRAGREYVKQIDKLNDFWGDNKYYLLVPENYDQTFKLANIQLVVLPGKGNYFWEQITLPKYFKREKGYYLLSLCNLCPLKLKEKNIVMIHDLAFIYHPEFYSWKFNTAYKFFIKREAKKSKEILTISEFSKKQLIETYHIPNNKIAILYSGIPNFSNNEITNKKLLDLTADKFYFSVGSASPNKNLKFILNLAKNNPNVNFVVSGAQNRVFASLPADDLPKNVQMTGYVSDDELAFLYSKCEGFVFPSIYEGFGLPPLEAVRCGCRKMIVSDIPTMHEIFDDLPVNYISPESSKPVSMDSFDKKLNDEQAGILQRRISYEKSAIWILDFIKNN